MQVTFPTGQFIGPGFHQIHTVREEEEEIWFMGHLVETKIHRIEEVHGIEVPDPGMDGPEDDENSWPARGSFTFADRTFTVVRDDDIGFWGFRDGAPLTKQDKMDEWKASNDAAIAKGAERGWWEIGPDGNPQRLPIKVSIAEMVAQNKPLMAHLMVDLEFFPSVGQARKNGWDKPLELGRHELGPKKKRAFVEIIP